MSDCISIPKRSIWSVLALVLVGGFTYLQAIGYLIPGFQQIFILKKEMLNITHVGLIWVPIISYVLVGVMICLTANIFKKLKSYEEKALISGLLMGFILGLILGLIAVLMGLILGLTLVPTRGLIGGLIVGLIVGLIGGLLEEF